MIVDTSAIMTILRDEPETSMMLEQLGRARRRRLSAGSWIELQAVLTRAGDADVEEGCQRLFRTFVFDIQPVTIEQARTARDAYREYGRGTQHRAKLNFGDCFAYALAKETGEPLLYKGNDFVHTDVVAAV